jgi:hypothetical protein
MLLVLEVRYRLLKTNTDRVRHTLADQIPTYGSSYIRGHSVHNAMEPASHRFMLSDRIGVLCQMNECCLKCILSIMVVAEHPSRYSQDHRAVSFDQDCEGLMVFVCQKGSK